MKYCNFSARKETVREKQLKEEEQILQSVAEKTALMGVAELAKGINYNDPIKTGLVKYTLFHIVMNLSEFFVSSYIYKLSTEFQLSRP